MSLYAPIQTNGSAEMAFNKLPIELNKTIAHHLPTNHDITAYRLTCKATNDAIDADRGSFWRARFHATYDLGPATAAAASNKELRRVYQRRSKVLRRTVGMESKNQNVLVEYIRSSKFLVNDCRPPPPGDKERNEVNLLLAAVKLMCVPLLFEIDDIKHHVFGVEELQRAVYAATNAAPLYTGPERTTVNLAWALQCLEFFRHHMTNQESLALLDALEELPPDQRPSAWREPLRTGAYKLDRHWKGTYAYLSMHEMHKLRIQGAGAATESFFTDLNVDEGKIQSLELDFVDEGELPWSAFFEDHLQSLCGAPPPTRPLKTQGRSQTQDMNAPQNLQFLGKGKNCDDKFQALGWVNGLPAQEGIPGWQRITLMKYFGGNGVEWDDDNLWAYEGVVLPGSRMILGRWWFASGEAVNFEDNYSGPFILWAVAGDGLEVEVEVDG